MVKERSARLENDAKKQNDYQERRLTKFISSMEKVTQCHIATQEKVTQYYHTGHHLTLPYHAGTTLHYVVTSYRAASYYSYQTQDTHPPLSQEHNGNMTQIQAQQRELEKKSDDLNEHKDRY